MAGMAKKYLVCDSAIPAQFVSSVCIGMASDPLIDDLETLTQQVAAEYVHRLFPSFRMPAFLACPDDAGADAVLTAIERAAAVKDVPMEIVDLRPAPAVRLSGVTARLYGFSGRQQRLEMPPVRILALKGFDLLEGPENDAPTYPFRSKFQFDEDYRWLFLGRGWHRLNRMFSSYHLPLYHAASDITPASWRTDPFPPKKYLSRRHDRASKP